MGLQHGNSTVTKILASTIGRKIFTRHKIKIFIFIQKYRLGKLLTMLQLHHHLIYDIRYHENNLLHSNYIWHNSRTHQKGLNASQKSNSGTRIETLSHGENFPHLIFFSPLTTFLNQFPSWLNQVRTPEKKMFRCLWLQVAPLA